MRMQLYLDFFYNLCKLFCPISDIAFFLHFYLEH